MATIAGARVTPSWSALKFHPIAEIFPLMEGEEFDALVEDIKKHGLRQPITLYKGKILDGRNRYRACLAAGKTPKFTTFKNESDPAAYVISVNIHRRHLTTKQKHELIAKLLKANPEKSDRQIAKTVKVSPTTVGTLRTKMEAKGDVSKLDTREDTKGRRQPARKEKQPDEQPAVIRNPPKTENKKEERALRRSDIEPAAISEVASKIIRADLQAARELYRILVAGGGDAACRFVRELAAGLENGFATDLAERAENAIVASPAAEPADVIEPDDCDGELV
jgi:ParB-like chromosome segregation protein Spo0J